ncbi:unknown protein [Waddlia chondrophila 2032/99]|uniref:Uncharacterized protein n=1 Tax=Waddlia chondrophila 2032/99 TaxID=765953 RepID=F8LAS2_9BACT|nr:unknown protein [Waddlia chondrophila 2032/99]
MYLSSSLEAVEISITLQNFLGKILEDNFSMER